MSEFRSDRWAANERIRRLETILEQRRPAPRPIASLAAMVGRTTVLVVMTAVLVAMSSVLGSVVYARTRMPVRDVELPPPPAPPAPSVRGGLGWYERGATHVGPWVVDVEGGTKLLIGLARDRTNDDAGLYAVAIDRTTLRTRWRAGPFPSVFTEGRDERHFAVVKDGHVVVTDAGGGVHVLDVRTGAEIFTHALRHAASSMCIDEDTGAIALTVEARYWDHSGAVLAKRRTALVPTDDDRFQTSILRYNPKPVDARRADTFKLVRSPVNAKCADAILCSRQQPDACKLRDERSTTPPTARIAGSTSGIWREGTVRVATGKVDTMRVAAGWDTTSGALRWESMIPKDVLPELREGSFAHHALRRGRFVSLYATETGVLRLVSLDARTGERRFDVEMSKSGLGSDVRSLSLEGDDVFVAIDDVLHVLDARTGITHKTLEYL